MALGKFAAAACAILVSACQFSQPYRQFDDAGADGRQTLVVAVTEAVLVKDRAQRDEFWRYVDHVEASLPQQPGLLGYAKRIELLGGRAWTMSVWTTAGQLDAFVYDPAHLAAMRTARGALKSFKTTRFEVPAREAPPKWQAALKTLEAAPINGG